MNSEIEMLWYVFVTIVFMVTMFMPIFFWTLLLIKIDMKVNMHKNLFMVLILVFSLVWLFYAPEILEYAIHEEAAEAIENPAVPQYRSYSDTLDLEIDEIWVYMWSDTGWVKIDLGLEEGIDIGGGLGWWIDPDSGYVIPERSE